MEEVPGVGPVWTPISPSAGSFFHADTHPTSLPTRRKVLNSPVLGPWGEPRSDLLKRALTESRCTRAFGECPKEAAMTEDVTAHRVGLKQVRHTTVTPVNPTTPISARTEIGVANAEQPVIAPEPSGADAE